MNNLRHFLSLAVLASLVFTGCSLTELNDDDAEFQESLLTRGVAEEVELSPINTDCAFIVESEKVFGFTELMEAAQSKESLTALFLARGLYGVDSYLTKYEIGRYYKAVVLKYPSVDPLGRKIWLSGRIYMSCDSKGKVWKSEHMVICSHYTIGSSAEAPSQMYTFDAGIALNKGLVVAPDYNGYGVSEANPHPYLCAELTAINAIDMMRAAKGYMASVNKPLAKTAKVYNLGYSQGGGSALAIQQYIEQNGYLQEFPLANTYCGAGVYSPEEFLCESLDSDYCQYPGGIPLILEGLKYAFPYIMTSPLEDFFSPAINNSSVFEDLRSKKLDVDQLAQSVRNAIGDSGEGGVKLSQVLSEAALTPGNPVYEQWTKAIRRNNLLNNGWTPSTPVHFLHYKYDETVPYNMFLEAQECYKGNSKAYFETVEYLILNDHRRNAGLFYARSIGGEYMKVKTTSQSSRLWSR